MLAGLSADGDVLAGIAGQSCGAGPGSFARARLRALHARSPWFRARPERWRARAPAHFHTAPTHDPEPAPSLVAWFASSRARVVSPLPSGTLRALPKRARSSGARHPHLLRVPGARPDGPSGEWGHRPWGREAPGREFLRLV